MGGWHVKEGNMKVFVFLCFVALSAGAGRKDQGKTDDKSEYAEANDTPFARSAAPISSTDYNKEKDILMNKMEMDFPHGFPGFPMPPPGFGRGDMHMPPFGMPPGYGGEDSPTDDGNMDMKMSHGAPGVGGHLGAGGHPGGPDFKAAAAGGLPFPPMPHMPPFPPMCPNMCDLDFYKKCTCLTPAAYTDNGRGNCNVGASKMDLRVWCYVDPEHGDPEHVCPDALPSTSKPGYYWSRIACITG